MGISMLLLSIKAGIVLTVLYGAYYLLFRNDSHFALRRGLLLTIVGLSLVIPLMEIRSSAAVLPETVQLDQIDQAFAPTPNTSPENNESAIGEDLPAQKAKKNFPNAQEILGLIYLTGVGISLLLFGVEVLKIRRLLRTGNRASDIDSRLIFHSEVSSPFSFWNSIIVPKTTTESTTQLDIIRQHEEAHLQLRHSIDLIFLSFFKSVLWYWPTSYLLHRSLKLVHEAQADQRVLVQVSLAEYGSVLTAATMQISELTIVHSFGLKSQLSKRIKLMYMKQTPFLRTSATLFLMLAISLIMAFNNELKGQEKRSVFAGQEKKPALIEGFEIVQSLIQNAPDEHITSVFLLGKDQIGVVMPVLGLPNHAKIFKKLEEKYPGERLRLTYAQNSMIDVMMGIQDDPYDDLYLNKLTDDDRRALVSAAEQWVKDNVHPVLPDYQLPQQDYFDHLEYVVVHKVSDRDESTFNTEKIFSMNEVELAPKPRLHTIGEFVEAVVLESELGKLDKKQLPEKFKFDFLISRSGSIIRINFRSEIDDANPNADALYALAGDLLKNIRKRSSLLGWEPGVNEGRRVTTMIELEIPASVF